MDTKWWNFDWAPNPAEWQAFAMFLTLGAAIWAGVAAYKQVKISRIATSDAAAAVKEANCPQIDIEFVVDNMVSSDPSVEVPSTLLLQIANYGPSAARNVRIVSTPALASSGAIKFRGVDMDPIQWLQELCSGKRTIAYLPRGKKLLFVLDDARKQFDNSRGLPRSYSFQVTYSDSKGEPYESFPEVDFESIGFSASETDHQGLVVAHLAEMNNIEKQRDVLQRMKLPSPTPQVRIPRAATAKSLIGSRSGRRPSRGRRV